MTTPWRTLFPTPNWLRWAIVPVLAFLATVTDRHYLADFWHHLARGRAIVEQGQMVDRDLFTFTVANKPLQDVNWLTQVGYYWLHEIGGLSLILVVNSLVISFTMLLVVHLCRRRSGSLLAGVIAAGVAFFGVWEVLTIRPQTLSMLLFLIVLDLLERSEKRPWLLVLPPLIVGLWSNMHGAFPLGIVLVASFAIGSLSAWRHQQRLGSPSPVHHPPSTLPLLLCLLMCVLASFANPYGWNVYQYVSATATVAYERQIAEWVRPRPDSLIGLMWMSSVVLVLGLLTWRWWRTRQMPALRDALLMGCFLALSAGSVRMVPWWILISAPVLAELLVWALPKIEVQESDAETPSVMASGVFALVVLAVVFSLPSLARLNPLLGPTRRGQRVEEDLEAVQRHLAGKLATGNVYSHFEWGEYLSWSITPQHRIFMDGRIEIYPNEVWEKYSTVTFGRDKWEEILDEYHIDYLVLDADLHQKTGMLARVAGSPIWQQAFQSRSAVLFVRKSGSMGSR